MNFLNKFEQMVHSKGLVQNVFDEDTVMQVSEISHEATGSFAREFPFALHHAIIQEMQAEKIESKMPLAPVAATPIKKGILYKLGAHVKNWKRRTFIALNVEDNFEIAYGEEEHGALSEKGRINCFGYIVESFSKEEEKKFGLYGFKLKNYQHADRVWYMRAESEEQLVEWTEIFANACKKTAQLDFQTPFVMTVFKIAYRAVRDSYGYSGKVEITGSPTEMLGQLVGDVIHQEFLRGTVSEKFRYVKEKAMEKEIQKIAMPSSASTWRHCVRDVSNQTAHENFIRHHLEEIRTVEERLMSSVSDEINEIIEPLLAKCREKLTTILELVSESMMTAYSAAMNGFCDDMNSRCTAMMTYAKARARTIANAYALEAEREAERQKRKREAEDSLRMRRETSEIADFGDLYVTSKTEDMMPSIPESANVSCYSTASLHSVKSMAEDESPLKTVIPDPFDLEKTFKDDMEAASISLEQFQGGQLSSTQAILREMYTVKLDAAKSIDIFQESMSAHGLYVLVIDDIRSLMRNGNHSFKSQAQPKLMWDVLTDHEDEQLSQWKDIIRDILPLFAEDAKLHYKHVTMKILHEIMENTIHEDMTASITEKVIDLDSQIPKTLRKALCIAHIAERWVRKIVNEFLLTLISGYCDKACSIIDEGLQTALKTIDNPFVIDLDRELATPKITFSDPAKWQNNFQNPLNSPRLNDEIKVER